MKGRVGQLEREVGLGRNMVWWMSWVGLGRRKRHAILCFGNKGYAIDRGEIRVAF